MQKLAILAFATIAFGQTKDTGPTLIASNIANFWMAYDAGQPGNREEPFQELYLDRASPGSQDLIKLRIGWEAGCRCGPAESQILRRRPPIHAGG